MKKIKNIEELVAAFKKLNVLIIGDVMLDTYMWGKVDRISPEAPVAIVAVDKKENRLGGAANVALNIQSLGATPLLCSVIGSGPNSRIFIELMRQQGLDTEGLYLSPLRTTTVKTRIIGNQHQMLRVDEETDTVISGTEDKHLFERVTSFIKNKKVDVIIFEDYDKGVITKTLIEKIVKLAKANKIPVSADPKRKNFKHYKNITLIKPNLKELSEGMKIDLEKDDLEGIKEAAKRLSKESGNESVLVTLSEQGAYIYAAKEDHHSPAHFRNISDVSGAGDTVISVASLCLPLNINMATMTALANLAGGIVCEKIGVVPIDAKQLIEEVNGNDLQF